MQGLIGKKIGMTQTFDEQENLTPVTVIEVSPCPIVQVKNVASDGYVAVRVGFGKIKPSRLKRPQQGVFKKVNAEPHKGLKEFRFDGAADLAVGNMLDVSMFQVGEIVDVTGKSKGRGFQGAVKRHHFRGGPKTHGQSDRLRAPGSVGASSSPSRVFKGTRMAGHMGDRQVTIRGLTVVRVDAERNLLLVKGAVPGARDQMVVIEKRG